MSGNIENNIHLTPEEKLNLKNLAVSVKYYNAAGDGDADDTSAFTKALENNSRVYVPGGTYRITGELTVPENCELELGRDVVLEFVPSNKRVIVDEETGNKITVNIEPEEFKCITLNPSSRLIGNHATISAPYSFEGSVLYAVADGPRYLKDINIVKLIESGEHEGCTAALDNVTDGTALLIERTAADDDFDSSILNGFDFSGLDIMGAFDYGIKCINTSTESPEIRYAETRIAAIIDGCRTSVYMNRYNDARISALIQPRLSYMSENNPANPRYAECGIHLVDSTEVDIRDSRIRNWDPSSEACSFSEEFQHVCMEGDCSGLSLDQSLCYDIDGYEIRDLIHTDSPMNLCNMTVFEEPNTDYINYHDENAVEGLLYRDVKIHSDDEHPHYKPGELVKTTGTTSTCLIPCTKNSIIIVKDFGFDDSTKTPSRIAFYKEDGGCIGVYNHSLFDDLGLMNYVPAESKIELTGKPTLNEVVCFRFCFNSDKLGLKPAIIVRETDGDTITKETTTYLKDGCLKDRIYFNAQFIYGLEKYIEDYLNPNNQSSS